MNIANTIEHDGQTLTMSQWAKILDMPKYRIKSRWDRGVRDPYILLHRETFHHASKWDYSNGPTPICGLHGLRATWHKNKARTTAKRLGQWHCNKCDSIKQKERRLKKRDTLGFQLSVALSSARSRNHCDLTLKDLDNMWESQNGLCAITSTPMQIKPGEGGHNRFKFSLDRIDNSKPYTKDNVWLVCEFINRAKSDLSVDELVAFAKGILYNFDRAVIA